MFTTVEKFSRDLKQKGLIRMINIEEWLDGVATYYVQHNIGNRMFVTFEEFANMVESGQWKRFITSGHGIPEVQPPYVKYDRSYKLIVTEDGYCIQCNKKGEINLRIFGTDLIAREEAIKEFEDIKKEVIGDFACTK